MAATSRPPCQVAVLSAEERSAAAFLESSSSGRKSLAAIAQQRRAQRAASVDVGLGSKKGWVDGGIASAQPSCGWSVTVDRGFEANGPRISATPTAGTGDLLRKLKDDQKRRQEVKAIDPNAAPKYRKKADSKGAKALVVEVPRPVFPNRSAPEDGRRREIATSMLEHAKSGDARVSVASSHEVDLEEVRKRLSAPTLSFTKDCDEWPDEEQEDGKDDLEVSMPQNSKMRSLLQREVQGKISFAQVRNLVEHGSRGVESPVATCG